MSSYVQFKPGDFELLIQKTKTDLNVFRVKAWEANILTDKEKKSLKLVNPANYGINRRFYNILRKKSLEDWEELVRLFERGEEPQPEFVIRTLKDACAEARLIVEGTRANLINTGLTATTVRSIDNRLQGIQQRIDKINIPTTTVQSIDSRLHGIQQRIDNINISTNTIRSIDSKLQGIQRRIDTIKSTQSIPVPSPPLKISSQDCTQQ